MKYGIIIAKTLDTTHKESFINIGDDFQGWAIFCLLMEIGIPREDIVLIKGSDLKSYVGEYIALPINYYVENHSSYEIFPLSPYIIPIFVGLHYRCGSVMKPEVSNYLRQWQPIGCRDEHTLQTLRNNGIEAYLFGCITATLPKATARTPQKIYCVDAPEAIIPYIPKKITDQFQLENISHIVHGNDFTPEKRKEILDDYINRYSKDAALVITSRLHCVSPCLAFGVPVIAVFENRSERLAWLDKLTPLYTVAECEKISWEPEVIDFEDVKNKMKQIAKNKIVETVQKYELVTELSFYWENREKSKYGNAYFEILLRDLKVTSNRFDYIIWGTGAVGHNVYKAVSELYPESRMVCAIDTYAIGEFFGQPIQSPETRHQYPNAIIFVASYSGRIEIESLLLDDGKTKGTDYVLFALTTG